MMGQNHTSMWFLRYKILFLFKRKQKRKRINLINHLKGVDKDNPIQHILFLKRGTPT